MYLEKNNPIAKQMSIITGYTGNNFSLEYTETIHFKNTFWDEGSRSRYYFIDLENSKSTLIPSVSPFDKVDKINFESYPLPINVGVVEYRQARYEHCALYLNPGNAIPLLESPKVEITRDEKIVLYATKSLKSSYAGIKDYRFYEAKNQTGITRVSWEIAKNDLMKKGLLNKAGAITVNGRDLVDKLYTWSQV